MARFFIIFYLIMSTKISSVSIKYSMCDLIVSLSLAVFEAEGKIRASVKITLENQKKRENVKVKDIFT